MRAIEERFQALGGEAMSVCEVRPHPRGVDSNITEAARYMGEAEGKDVCRQRVAFHAVLDYELHDELEELERKVEWTTTVQTATSAFE